MHLVLISPEIDRPDEGSVVDRLFATGLERYHLRKPHTSAADLQRAIERIPAQWHPRLVLHQHHELVEKYGLGGRHWKDDATAARACGDAGGAPSPRSAQRAQSPAGWGHSAQSSSDDVARPLTSSSELSSRSCHDLTTLVACLGSYDSVFFGPVFPSISKPGYGLLRLGGSERGRPDDNEPTCAPRYEELARALSGRTEAQRRTIVLALGGINAATARVAMRLGFDGVAVLGAIWQASDPIAAFVEIRTALRAAAPAGDFALAGAGARASALPSSSAGAVASSPNH